MAPRLGRAFCHREDVHRGAVNPMPHLSPSASQRRSLSTAGRERGSRGHRASRVSPPAWEQPESGLPWGRHLGQDLGRHVEPSCRPQCPVLISSGRWPKAAGASKTAAGGNWCRCASWGGGEKGTWGQQRRWAEWAVPLPQQQGEKPTLNRVEKWGAGRGISCIGNLCVQPSRCPKDHRRMPLEPSVCSTVCPTSQ